MAFVIDSAEWDFNGWTSSDVQHVIEGLLDQLAHIAENREEVWVGDDLQTRAVYKGMDLWRLRDVESEIQLDDEVWQELAAHLGRIPRYLDDEDRWPDGIDDFCIAIGSEAARDNIDVAWAHHHIRARKAVACLGLKRRGPLQTTTKSGTADVHWIRDEASEVDFWQSAIVVEGDTKDVLERLCHRAYPNLHFAHNVLHNADQFNGGYYSNLPQLKHYLKTLNEHGIWVFTAPPPAENRNDPAGTATIDPTAQLIQRRFELLGLVIAPENPDVFRNGVCRRAREIVIGGRSLYCEWHCKLQAHQNRVHIHSPVIESEGKLVIAIIARHLPLPGD
ncbi:hypothetical protein [Azospira sp. I09]|uniref:hypothetical protein n=1 Tax=Azospira sp. I09 TaxID=1765049 RepID=UPI0012608EDF|nr:hypothetical protein [Azospira sp. I09]BBN89444.1 hypothetical protein AZSP09_24670 [Azospira sp. I09]